MWNKSRYLKKKVKKVEIFRPKPLTTAAESSIIGLTREREG